MGTYAQQAAEAGDRYLAALAATQDRVIQSLSATHPTAAPANPATAAALQATRQLSDVGYSFALKLLEQQQGFFAKLTALQSRKTQRQSGSTKRETPATTQVATAQKGRAKVASKRTASKKPRTRSATPKAATPIK